jgi:putative flavoprotein involved in K+ transport
VQPTFVPVVVIGAGHAGLAMSRRLTERSIDHVVLERGVVANSWRSERWDSLRLLTPTWHNRLPGGRPQADDPDGFMTAAEAAAMIDRYAGEIGAPVIDHTTVSTLRASSSSAPSSDSSAGYEVVTNRGVWTSAAVFVATGGCSRAAVPEMAAALPSSVDSVTALTYRNPAQLADGGVLVVGASATGAQLAEEIHASGRPVTLAVGEHVRMPRMYRGRDVFSWAEAAGVLDERYDEVDDIVRVRHLPSPQLIGTPQRRTIDLNALQDLGVGIVGRLGRIRDGVAQFSGGLANVCTLADLKLGRLLARFDEAAACLDGDVGSPERLEPTRTPRSPRTDIDLVAAGIRTVVWANGLRPDHRWIDLPVFDHAGRIRHDGGVVIGAPGMYVLALGALRRRRSSYIAGAAQDTAELAEHLHGHLDTRASRFEGHVPAGMWSRRRRVSVRRVIRQVPSIRS